MTSKEATNDSRESAAGRNEQEDRSGVAPRKTPQWSFVNRDRRRSRAGEAFQPSYWRFDTF
jgi:hypothetical protein